MLHQDLDRLVVPSGNHWKNRWSLPLLQCCRANWQRWQPICWSGARLAWICALALFGIARFTNWSILIRSLDLKLSEYYRFQCFWPFSMFSHVCPCNYIPMNCHDIMNQPWNSTELASWSRLFICRHVLSPFLQPLGPFGQAGNVRFMPEARPSGCPKTSNIYIYIFRIF